MKRSKVDRNRAIFKSQVIKIIGLIPLRDLYEKNKSDAVEQILKASARHGVIKGVVRDRGDASNILGLIAEDYFWIDPDDPVDSYGLSDLGAMDKLLMRMYPLKDVLDECFRIVARDNKGCNSTRTEREIAVGRFVTEIGFGPDEVRKEFPTSGICHWCGTERGCSCEFRIRCARPNHVGHQYCGTLLCGCPKYFKQCFGKCKTYRRSIFDSPITKKKEKRRKYKFWTHAD